ncbi:MAG: hypothetical protein RLY70_4399, partial [Planctomycetota bacterium]
SFTAKPKALAGLQSEIGSSAADRSAKSVAKRDRR